MSAQPGVRLSVAGSVATVTLCRPDVLNAQTPAMWGALAAFGQDLDPAVRVVVVRGEGRAFSAGLDRSDVAAMLAGMAAKGDAELDALIAGYQAGFSWLRRHDINSVAAVHGHAIGAGFQLALACDLRVVADSAQFCMGEIALGLVPDLTGTKALLDAVGPSRALEVCVTGRKVGAEEAVRIGLATIVVPDAELDAAVGDLVAALLAPSHSAVTETKALLRGAAARSYEEQFVAERAAQVRRIRAIAARRNPPDAPDVGGSGGGA
jgi:enoyl-CoA hydratase/carnithine racemase